MWKGPKSQFVGYANTWRLPDPIKALDLSSSSEFSGPRGPRFDECVEPPFENSNVSLSFPFTFQDSHGIETNGPPLEDVSQDVHALSGSQNETHTTVTFRRKWQTCDPQDRQLTVSPEKETSFYNDCINNPAKRMQL